MRTSKEISNDFFDRTHSEIDHDVLDQLYFDLHKEVLNESVTKDKFLSNTNKPNQPYYEKQEPMTRSTKPVQEPQGTPPPAPQSEVQSTLQTTLEALSDAGVQLDPSDNNALKGLLKQHKGNKEIYLLLLKAKKLHTRVQRTSDATDYKYRGQLTDIEKIIEDWNRGE